MPSQEGSGGSPASGPPPPRKMLAASEYSAKSSALIQLTNQLRDVGAERELALPTVVVCGNQSAGKSSLLERLCGVQLPRASGTCTKCPTEVRMSAGAGDHWSCRVFLSRKYDANGAPLDKTDHILFVTLDDSRRGDLALVIRAAQAAQLNPGQPHERFAKLAEGSVREAEAVLDDRVGRDELKFTRNAVVLEISGADVDLSLIDLPGIIQSDEDNPENKTLVLDLVKGYIKESRTIIVAAVSCKDDANNQAILDLAREADPKGQRTLGVLTKPDTIEEGTHGQWLPLLQGQKFCLDLGYCAVKNPSQRELEGGITAEEASVKEAAFFRDDPFWSSQDLAELRGRFGVENLRRELSAQLVRVTREELPKMQQAVHDALAKVDKQLAGMPSKLNGDPSHELHRLCMQLSKRLRDAVEGRDGGELWRALNKISDGFARDILNTRPFFKVTSDEGDSSSSKNNRPSEDQEAVEFWLDEQPDGTPAITLDEIRRLASDHRSDQLPGWLPYRTLDILIAQRKHLWDRHIDACLEDVASELERLVAVEVAEVFGRFPAAHKAVKLCLDGLYQELLEATATQLGHLKEMEGTFTFTLNAHYYSDAWDKFGGVLKQRYYKAIPASSHRLNYLQNALGNLANAGIAGLTTTDLQQRLLKDTEGVAPLLDMAAGTLAYFKVACKRVVDAVPLHIRLHLLKRFVERVEGPLFQLVSAASAAGASGQGQEGDGAAGPGPARALSAAELLQEEPHTAERRKRALAQRAQLLAARKLLAAF